jgi:hypothetical protein
MSDTEQAPQEPEETPTEGEQPTAEAAETAEGTEAEAPATGEATEAEATPAEGEQPPAETEKEEKSEGAFHTLETQGRRLHIPFDPSGTGTSRRGAAAVPAVSAAALSSLSPGGR